MKLLKLSISLFIFSNIVCASAPPPPPPPPPMPGVGTQTKSVEGISKTDWQAWPDSVEIKVNNSFVKKNSTQFNSWITSKGNILPGDTDIKLPNATFKANPSNFRYKEWKNANWSIDYGKSTSVSSAGVSQGQGFKTQSSQKPMPQGGSGFLELTMQLQKKLEPGTLITVKKGDSIKYLQVFNKADKPLNLTPEQSATLQDLLQYVSQVSIGAQTWKFENPLNIKLFETFINSNDTRDDLIILTQAGNAIDAVDQNSTSGSSGKMPISTEQKPINNLAHLEITLSLLEAKL